MITVVLVLLTLVGAALTVIAVVLGLLWYLRNPLDAATLEPVRALARAEGMTVRRFPGVVLKGRFRGRHAHVRWRKTPARTELALSTTCRSLEARRAGTPPSSATGDLAFDEAVGVKGRNPSAMLALLGEQMRARLREWIAEGLTIESGELRVSADGILTDPLALTSRLVRLGEIATILEAHDGRSVPARLADIAGSDPVPGVRRRALDLLGRHYAETVFAAEAARRAIADPDSGVRAQAAPLESGSLGDALIAAVRDAGAPEKDRRDALARAAAVLERDEMIELYEVALGSAVPALQRDGISGFARLRHGAGIARLKRLAHETDDLLTLTDLADALAQIAGPGAEDALLDLLARPEPQVQLLAARGLGRIGSPSAVAALRPFATAALGAPDVREAAGDAIAAIRTRYPGAAENAIELPKKDTA